MLLQLGNTSLVLGLALTLSLGVLSLPITQSLDMRGLRLGALTVGLRQTGGLLSLPLSQSLEVRGLRLGALKVRLC